MLHRSLRAGALALALATLCAPTLAQAQAQGSPSGGATAANQSSQITQETAAAGALGPTNASAAANPSATASINGVLKGLWTSLNSLFGTANGYLSTIATNSATQATAANQAAANTSLSTIATNSASQATAANQVTGNTSLSTIATNTTGAATGAKQDTGNTSVASIDAGIGGASAAVAGNTGASTANGFLRFLRDLFYTTPPATAANQATANTSLSTIVTNSGTTNTDLGPPGATACTTDTGSCSLNALAQRIAQRLTTLNTTLGSPFQAGAGIANLPSTVDTNTGAPSASTLRVVNANPTSVVTGQYKITASAVAIGSSTALVNGVVVKAKTGNAGAVWIGGASVTAADDGTGNGYKLLPGESASFAATNVANLYAIGTANDVIYFEGN